MDNREKDDKKIVELVDLRGITRYADQVVTDVTLMDRYGCERVPWLKLGASQVRYFDNKNTWWLAAYMTSGVTDFEHDSAYALRLPLIGLAFDGVEYGATRLTAWIDPDGADEFCVPTSSDYDPTKREDASICDYGACKEKPHPMVAEGFYVPPFDRGLFGKVRGKRVLIRIGPVWKEEDDE